jgi:hypothetical protein
LGTFYRCASNARHANSFQPLRLSVAASNAQEVVMNEARFEDLLRSLATARSRRGFLAVLGAAALAALPGAAGTVEARSIDDPHRLASALAGAWLAWAHRRAFAPVTEAGTVDCAAGQAGATWFLAGSELEIGPVSRACTVPRDRRLFFPVVSAFCAEPRIPSRAEGASLGACAASFIDLFPPVALTATLNGDPTPIVRAQSPLVPVRLERDNPFAAPAGDYLETADGYWVLLDPLPPGDHTVRVAAASDLDVTYELTVV